MLLLYFVDGVCDKKTDYEGKNTANIGNDRNVLIHFGKEFKD